MKFFKGNATVSNIFSNISPASSATPTTTTNTRRRTNSAPLWLASSLCADDFIVTTRINESLSSSSSSSSSLSSSSSSSSLSPTTTMTIEKMKTMAQDQEDGTELFAAARTSSAWGRWQGQGRPLKGGFRVAPSNTS